MNGGKLDGWLVAGGHVFVDYLGTSVLIWPERYCDCEFGEIDGRMSWLII